MLFISVLTFRCGTAIYIPAAPDEARTGIMLDTLKQGRILYVSKCSSCHNLFPPEKFSRADWEKNVGEMQKKANISDVEKGTMLKYLQARSMK